MKIHNVTPHQQAQINLINKIEIEAKSNSMQFTTVEPVKDYEDDSRIALTSVHFPHDTIKKNIEQNIINPLKKIAPQHYYYLADSLHLTVKNIRLPSDPPNFDKKDVEKVKKIFDEAMPKHHKLKTYFYRLLLFPNNLSLIGTTDSELDSIHTDLDKRLKEIGLPDDKMYLNKKYFFCNITLARFTSPLKNEYKNKIEEISENVPYIFSEPYEIDSVTLLSSNAICRKKTIINTWKLKPGHPQGV